MPTVYPGALDALTNPTGAQLMSDPALLHSFVEGIQNDAIEAIQATLGINPQGAAASVAARIAATEAIANGGIPLSTKAAALGVASLDAASMLVQNVDASKVTSGTLAVLRIPNLDASKVTTGSFATAQIPNLDAAKITSGVFGTARIPGLPGTWITSGTIDAARLPSSVTANANATVVADLAGRDAILVADRADGKIVVQRDKMIIWVWRSDNSTWVKMPNVQNVVLGSNVNSPLNGTWGSATPLEFDAIAGETYRVRLVGFAVCSGSSGVDIRYGWSWTGAGTMSSGVQGPDPTVVAPNTTGPGQWGATTADATSPLQPGTVVGAVGLPSGLPVMHTVYATYVCTTSGKVTLNIAQDISNATFVVTLLPGTDLRVERIV